MSKKDVKLDDLVSIKPITDNQKVVFDAWRKQDKNLFLFGAAGTGKTFISLYLALEQVLDPKTKAKQQLRNKSNYNPNIYTKIKQKQFPLALDPICKHTHKKNTTRLSHHNTASTLASCPH